METSQTVNEMLLSLFPATGADRFSANIRDMTGRSPLPVFKLCWKYLTPAVCTVSDVDMLNCPFNCGVAQEQHTVHIKSCNISYICH